MKNISSALDDGVRNWGETMLFTIIRGALCDILSRGLDTALMTTLTQEVQNGTNSTDSK